ncbi:PEP-CTERM sorting domain-containing protein [Alteromonas macleodii]|uniref:PEP-CTERM sorting domain-containing protein n=1 Tax=Alteromonas macleodii TaxID=28108 RepID=UPI00313EA76E
MTNKKNKSYLKAFAVLATAFSFNVSAAFIDIGFTIDGNTWDNPFTVQNNSSAGLEITQFALDLRPNSDSFLCFDEVVNSCHSSGGLNFKSVGSDDVGFLTYSVVDAVGGIDAADFLSVTFNGFSSGESFSWLIDVDDNPDGSVFGNDLIGSLFYVEMSDGITYQGIIQGIDGNDDAGQLVLQGVSSTTIANAITSVPEPSSILLFGGLLLALTRIKRKNII